MSFLAKHTLSVSRDLFSFQKIHFSALCLRNQFMVVCVHVLQTSWKYIKCHFYNVKLFFKMFIIFYFATYQPCDLKCCLTAQSLFSHAPQNGKNNFTSRRQFLCRLCEPIYLKYLAQGLAQCKCYINVSYLQHHHH